MKLTGGVWSAGISTAHDDYRVKASATTFTGDARLRETFVPTQYPFDALRRKTL